MKAIVTKYHGPTNTKGSRITASDRDGNRVSIPFPLELSEELVYRRAAQALCDKMKWTGQLIGGGTKDGYVFVFSPLRMENCFKASSRIADTIYTGYARKVAATSTWAEIIASEMGIEV